ITPAKKEIKKGSGGCNAGIRLNETEEQYVPSGELLSFASSNEENGIDYGYLKKDFGEWKIKIIVKKGNSTWNILTTSFDYLNLKKDSTECKFETAETKKCIFRNEEYEISKLNGCGINPIYLTITYKGNIEEFSSAQGEKIQLKNGVNIILAGIPCGQNIAILRFEKEIPE
ncbi:MAG: hypothetical protein JW703_03260, partial [Candidatus Diapherotrites archaeon]|nr:hypothetical protein [Candidatus Diapherotrites archaeon]